MQKYFLIAFVGLLLIWTSCGGNGMDEISITTGDEYIDANSDIYFTDTFTVETSTVIADSVATSNTGVALVGKFYNDDLGTVEAQSVFRVSNPSNTDIELDEAPVDEFDSVTIKMDYSQYYIGDTTQTFEFGLYELTTDVEEIYDDRVIEETQYGFYNSDVVETKEDPIVTFKLSPPRPTKAKDFEVRLPDEWGQEIFNMIGNDEFDDSNTRAFSKDKFYDYIKGFVLKSTAESDNQAILGFLATADSMQITIYFNGGEAIENDDDPTDDDYTITFSLSEDAYQFNSIIADRSSSALETLKTQEDNVYSEDSDNKTFIQGGTGLMTKVRFPYLGQIFQETEKDLNSIVRAQLLLYPVHGMDDILDDMPSTLAIYNTNKINTNLGSVTIDNSTATMALGQSDEDVENQYYYYLDITEPLVEEVLDDYEYDPQFSFLIAPNSSDINESVMTMIIAGHDAGLKYQPKLRLYTYTY